MKALITGVNGFVGPYLAQVLLNHTIEVVGIDRQSTTALKGIHYYETDLLDKKKLKIVIDKERPDYIFHLAGISSVQQSWEQPELTHEINVTGTMNLLEAIPKSFSPKILFISTAEVYGIPKDVPIKETHPINPQNPYAKSKLKAEQFVRESGFSYIISRSFQHIGPGQKPGFVCSDFAQQIAEIEKKKQKPVIYVGNLDAIRDFTDVRDIVQAYSLAMTQGKEGEIYNICSGKRYVIKDILNMFLKMSTIKINITLDPRKVRPIKIPVQVGDNSKFIQQTGWHPAIPIEKTLQDIMNYWRNQV